MSGLVISDDFFFFRADDLVLFFQTADHLVERVVEVVHIDRIFAAAGCNEGGLVADVGDVGAYEAWGHFGQGVRGHLICHFDVFEVHLEYLLATVEVGTPDADLSVEAPGAHEGLVEDIRSVGSGHEYHALVGRESIHLDEQLVEGVLALVVAALYCAATSGPADGVYFVDKDDTGAFSRA